MTPPPRQQKALVPHAAWRGCLVSIIVSAAFRHFSYERTGLSLEKDKKRVPENTSIMALPYHPRQLYYDGKPQPAFSGRTFQTTDPSNATPLADVHLASTADVDKAIASAERAFPSWSRTPPIVRARILQKAALLLRERNDEIAKVETQDTGKAYTETSTVDVVTGADVLEYYANYVGGGGLNGETTQLREDAWVYTKKAALGVCVGIGAWNYPIQM